MIQRKIPDTGERQNAIMRKLNQKPGYVQKSKYAGKHSDARNRRLMAGENK